MGLVSAVLNGGAAAAGVPAGRAVDRVGERLVIGGGAVASGVAVLALHTVTGLTSLLAVLLVLGFLTTVAVPAGGALVHRLFLRNERAMVMGIRQTGVPLGGALSALTLPPIALLYGWRVALDVAAAITVAIGVVVLVAYRDPVEASGIARGSTARLGISQLLRRKEILALALYATMFGGAQWCVLTYLVLYLNESLDVPLLVATSLLAACQVCGVGARVGWGIVSDRLMGGRRAPVMALIGVMGMGGTLALSTFSLDTPYWLIALVVGVLGITLLGWNGLPHVLAPEFVGPSAAGVAVGLINSSGFLGVILFPPLFGLLVDATGTYRISWVALIVLLTVGLLVLRVAQKAEANAARE